MPPVTDLFILMFDYVLQNTMKANGKYSELASWLALGGSLFALLGFTVSLPSSLLTWHAPPRRHIHKSRLTANDQNKMMLVNPKLDRTQPESPSPERGSTSWRRSPTHISWKPGGHFCAIRRKSQDLTDGRAGHGGQTVGRGFWCASPSFHHLYPIL